MVEFLYGEPLQDRGLVESLQEDLGIEFPGAYLAVVSENDGASLEPSTSIVVDPATGSKEAIACNSLIPFGGGEDAFDMRLANTGGTDGLPKGIVVFGLEGGGVMFGFDYRETGSGDAVPIVALNFENPDDHLVARVADDFEAFLAALVPDPGTQNIP